MGIVILDCIEYGFLCDLGAIIKTINFIKIMGNAVLKCATRGIIRSNLLKHGPYLAGTKKILLLIVYRSTGIIVQKIAAGQLIKSRVIIVEILYILLLRE